MDATARRIVTVGVESIEEVKARQHAALAEGRFDGSHITFVTPELLWRTLTEKRWALIKMMAGQGPMAIREAARRLGRDVKAVHGDVTALRLAGIIRNTGDGRIEFPYDEIRVNFTIPAAAA